MLKRFLKKVSNSTIQPIAGYKGLPTCPKSESERNGAPEDRTRLLRCHKTSMLATTLWGIFPDI